MLVEPGVLSGTPAVMMMRSPAAPNFSLKVMRQARSGTEITTCPTCGRILYPLGEAKYTAFDHDLDNIDR